MNFKLALAAAAVVGLAGTAQAADLGKKAPAAANYVKVCDAYGAGYFYIPGSETCLKIGGFARFQLDAFSNNHAANLAMAATAPFGNARLGNSIRTLARADIQLDARTATEMGLLRSFIEVIADNMSYGAAWGGGNQANGAMTGATNTYVNQAFVQFAGITAGRAQSFYDFFTAANPAFTLSSTTGPATDKKVNLLAYTFAFGNGITASLSVEDPSTAANGNLATSDSRRWGYLGATTSNNYGGVKTPDLIANINVTQAWGSAQLSGVLHDDFPSDSTLGSKMGWAIQGGVSVNLPMIAAGDVFTVNAAYGRGATGYVNNYNGLSDFILFDGANVQTTAASVAAGFHHNWSSTLGSSLLYGYTAVWAAGTTIQDRNVNDVRANLVWAPVKGLTIGGEVDYISTKFRDDQGVATRQGWTFSTRIQRNF